MDLAKALADPQQPHQHRQNAANGKGKAR